MTTRGWTILIVVLAIIIVVLAWFLFTLPAPSRAVATSTGATTTSALNSTSTESGTGAEPLHARIVVTYPTPGATVQPSFTVIGKVPGTWSSEAQFPVMVRDESGNKIAQASAHLEGDWMTSDLVDFTADLAVSGYHGPATLVLLKDNPSGLPENDDSLEIPIVIQ